MAGRKWTEQERETVFRLYADTETEVIAKMLNRTICQVYNFAYSYGIKKSEAYMAEKRKIEIQRLNVAGVKSRFKNGQKPWNTGTKGLLKANKTSFKKGIIPQNTKPIGSERRDKDNQILVKTENGYVRKARVIWEQFHGPIPEGYRVILLDKNPDNLAIENMKLGSMADLMRGNCIHRFPKEIVKTIKMIHKLKRKIHEKQNSRP